MSETNTICVVVERPDHHGDDDDLVLSIVVVQCLTSNAIAKPLVLALTFNYPHSIIFIHLLALVTVNR